jgi:tetratricopeptide (TPR) repeat protein
MKIKIWITLGFISLASYSFGQSQLQQFSVLASKNDTIGELTFLKNWEATNKNDPDLYVAWFNFYFLKSKKEVVRLDADTTKQEGFKVNDPITKKRVGSIYGDIYYDPQIVNKGIQYIDIGIDKFPSRLDMRFGKVYVYGIINDFEHFTSEIVKAIDYSNIIKNKWTWKENKPLEDPKTYMLGTIQSYQNQLYNTGNDSLLIYMSTIAKTILKYYPDHIESLSNLSIVYLINKDYKKAIETLKKAEKLNPSDYIVLGNLARAYQLDGDKINAIKYYELEIKYGDQPAKEFAKNQIKDLQKK